LQALHLRVKHLCEATYGSYFELRQTTVHDFLAIHNFEGPNSQLRSLLAVDGDLCGDRHPHGATLTTSNLTGYPPRKLECSSPPPGLVVWPLNCTFEVRVESRLCPLCVRIPYSHAHMMVQSRGDSVYLAKQNDGALSQPSASPSSKSPLTTPLTQPQPNPTLARQ